MKFYTKNLINIFLLIILNVILGITLSACSSKKPFDGIEAESEPTTTTLPNYSGKIVVTTVATDPGTGPGLVTMFNSNGTIHSTLRDLYPNIEWASSSVFVPPENIYLLIANADRIENMNLTEGTNSVFTTARVNGTINRVLARDPADGSIYMAEQIAATSTIEKYNSNGSLMGAPFVNSTTGSCTLNTPTGMAVITTTGNLAVLQNNRLNLYSSSGACLATVTAAPLNANTPYTIAYHSQTDRLLVGFAGNSQIHACNTSGASCTSIYNNITIVSVPRSIAVDASGAIYVGSAGTDTVEKFTWSGSGQMLRSSTTPLIGPGIYSQNPASIMVIP